ncbi:MAG: hypothetical protein ABSB19_18520, partial [Methylomonas sp.]
FITELQHNYSNSSYSLLSGFGRIDQQAINSNSANGTVSIPLPPPLSPLSFPYTTNGMGLDGFRRTNFYNYSKFYLPGNVSATMGISADFYGNGSSAYAHLKPVNPKFGLVWNPTSSTTVRAAVFRALSVTYYANQTIEPTQVAGFNQFFDDPVGSFSWRYGLGVDHKISDKFASGLEYSQRNINYTVFNPYLYRSEHTGRAYFNYLPSNWMSLGLEYFYEKIHQPGLVPDYYNAYSGYGLFNDVETHRIPLTLSFYDTSGLSFKFKYSYVHQSGMFQNVNTDKTAAGVSSFFVADLNVNYRLPGRHGMLSLGINNLFNEDYRYQNTDYNNVTIVPGRILFSRITLAF